MNLIVDYGDATALTRSIFRAADILRGRGIIVDLEAEMPHSGQQDYFMVLRHLHEALWLRVKVTNKRKVKRYARQTTAA